MSDEHYVDSTNTRQYAIIGWWERGQSSLVPSFFLTTMASNFNNAHNFQIDHFSMNVNSLPGPLSSESGSRSFS